jgi:hypothetical protein
MRLLALGVALSLAAHAPAGGPARTWTFDSDVEGWVIHDCNCGSNFAPVLATLPLVWSPAGGDPAGYVSHLDNTSQCIYFAAPAGELGDLTPLIRGSLRFSLQCSIVNYSTANQVIVIGANGTILLAALPNLPSTTQWTRYSVPLVPSRSA